MKHLYLAAALALSATTAHAHSMDCDAPQMLVTSDRYDLNPVVSITVDRTAGQWRVVHFLADGAVVARNDQYLMLDQPTTNEARWAGSLRKNPNLMMIGRAWANPRTGEGVYEEWLYDRSRGDRLDMHSRANCRIDSGVSMNTASRPDIAIAEESFQVPADISSGHLNIRNGPGVNYALVGAIPAGSILRGKPPLQCSPREDGIRGADWCHIGWRGVEGWVSRAGLMPLGAN